VNDLVGSISSHAEKLFQRRGNFPSDDVQNLSQCAGRPAGSSRCKSDTMKE
jgi:hypothetical protein